jgi:hypothetical protein
MKRFKVILSDETTIQLFESDAATSAECQGQFTNTDSLPQEFPETVEEALVVAKALKIPDEYCRETWELAMSRGGKDSKNNVIVSWPHYLSVMHRFFKNNGGGTTNHKNNGRASDDRNRGTLNEGKGAQYRGVGKVG